MKKITNNMPLVCAAVLAAGIMGTSCAAKRKPPVLSASPRCGQMMANNVDQCVLKIDGLKSDDKTAWTVTATDEKGKAVTDAVTIIEQNGAGLTIQAGLKPCSVKVAAKNETELKFTKTLTIPVVEDYSDSDGDGFPDVVELNSKNDRLSFTGWFTTIAESQKDVMSDAWNDENHDCAGLVRFAYREVLRQHDSDALAKFKSLARTDIPDVGKYSYPDVPIIGQLLFRNKPGPFKKSDLTDGTFAPFVTARLLQEANTHFVSKDLSKAEPGDIIFFLHFDDVNMPYHTMIFLGTPPKHSGAKPMIVYHTGPVHNTNGRIKLISIDDLMNFPDERWHPVEENKYFLGVYRFNILE
jgi:uncharacterized protein